MAENNDMNTIDEVNLDLDDFLDLMFSDNNAVCDLEVNPEATSRSSDSRSEAPGDTFLHELIDDSDPFSRNFESGNENVDDYKDRRPQSTTASDVSSFSETATVAVKNSLRSKVLDSMKANNKEYLNLKCSVTYTSELTPEEQKKRKDIKERNRISAKKSRDAKKQKYKAVKKEKESLTKENRQLKDDVEYLRQCLKDCKIKLRNKGVTVNYDKDFIMKLKPQRNGMAFQASDDEAAVKTGEYYAEQGSNEEPTDESFLDETVLDFLNKNVDFAKASVASQSQIFSTPQNFIKPPPEMATSLSRHSSEVPVSPLPATKFSSFIENVGIQENASGSNINNDINDLVQSSKAELNAWEVGGENSSSYIDEDKDELILFFKDGPRPKKPKLE